MPTKKTGAIDMTELLADLLGALGIDLPATSSDADFKRELVSAAMAKLKELTGAAGASRSAGDESPTNPLIAGRHTNDLQVEQQPMYMSLNNDDLAAAIARAMTGGGAEATGLTGDDLGRIAAEAERRGEVLSPEAQRIALSLGGEAERLQRERGRAEERAARQREERLNAMYARRDERVSRLVQRWPQCQARLCAALSEPSMAFSADSDADPAEAVLKSFEVELAGWETEIRRCVEPRLAREDEYAELLAKHMR